MKKCSSVDGDKVGILGGRTHTHTHNLAKATESVLSLLKIVAEW